MESPEHLQSAQSYGSTRARFEGAAKAKQSGLGIASFILSLLCGIGVFALFMFAGALEMSTPGGLDEDSLAMGLIGIGIIGFLAVSVVGLALGIAALVQTGRKKVFAILGTVFSALVLFGTGFLILLGLLVE